MYAIRLAHFCCAEVALASYNCKAAADSSVLRAVGIVWADHNNQLRIDRGRGWRMNSLARIEDRGHTARERVTAWVGVLLCRCEIEHSRALPIIFPRLHSNEFPEMSNLPSYVLYLSGGTGG